MRWRATALLLLAVACSGNTSPPRPQSAAQRVSCLALDSVRGDVARGRLRAALSGLEPVARFCDAPAAKALRAELLIDLARYAEARPEVDDLVRAGAPGASALQSELRRRTTPPSAELLARAQKLFREALESDSNHAPALFLQAWDADPPSGLALVRAALAQRAQAHAANDASRSAVRTLLERGVAELERETGRHAHAGRRAPPVCAGHFSNHLTVAWLRDGRHAVVQCTDGSAIVDTVTGARVANHAGSIDETRLPRLRFTSKSPDDFGDRRSTCPADIRRKLTLDADRGVLTSSSGTGVTSSVLSNVFRSVSEKLRARSEFPPTWSLHCVPEADADLVVIQGEWVGSLTALPTYGLGVYDIARGRFIGVAAGGQAHVIDGGRIVVRGPDGVTVLGKSVGAPIHETGAGADLSYDGKQLVFVKEEAGGEDPIFHPVWPYVRRALRGPEQRLGDFGSGSEVELPVANWPRVGPFEPTTCANLGVMPSSEPQCIHPEIRLEGVDYGSGDEIACSTSSEPSPTGGVRRRVTCLDPRGPVAVDDPWAEDFVCRVGPHVLPLGACPHLLSDRK